MEELPVSILDRYCNKTRDQFLVTVFPSGKLWENPESLHSPLCLCTLDLVSKHFEKIFPLILYEIYLTFDYS